MTPEDRSQQIELRVELGRVWLSAEDAAAIEVGSRIELDSPADEAVGIYVGDRRIACGAAAVTDGNWCVRVSQVLAAASEAAGAVDPGPRDP